VACSDGQQALIAPNGDRPMSLQLDTRVESADYFDPEVELDRPWVETAVTAAGAMLTVLFVSSVAVLMYLA
jgi:hypothetical protein